MELWRWVFLPVLVRAADMVWHNTKVIHICNIISVCGCVYFPRLVSLSVTFSTLCFHPGSWGVVSLWDRQRDKQSWTTPPLLFPPYPAPCKDMHSKNRKCVFHSAWNLPSPPSLCHLFPFLHFLLCLSILSLVSRDYSDLGQKVFKNCWFTA